MAYGPGPFSQYGSSGTQAYGMNNGPMGYGNGYFGSPWGFMGGYGGTPTGAETSKPGIGNNRGIVSPPIQRVGGSPGQPGTPISSSGGGGATNPISVAGNGPGQGGQGIGQPPGIGTAGPPGAGGGRGGNQLPWAPWHHDYNTGGSHGTLTGGQGLGQGGRGSSGSLSGQRNGLGLGGSQSNKLGQGGNQRMTGGQPPTTGGISPIDTLMSYLGGYTQPGGGPFL